MDSQHARQRESAAISNFQTLFRRGLTLVHPTTAESISPKDWFDVELIEDDLLQLAYHLERDNRQAAHHASYPRNARVLYWVEPKSQGRMWQKGPREGLVIECAVVGRLERYTYDGYDDEELGWTAADQELLKRQARAQRWSKRYGTPTAYVVGLASPTGWTKESSNCLRNSFADAHVFPYLVDLSCNVVHAPSTTEAENLDPFLELFERSLGERKLEQIKQQIRNCLLINGAVRLTDLQAQIGSSRGLLREACEHLVMRNPDYRVVAEGDSAIIRSD